MKKVVLAFLILIPSVLAISTNMKEFYQPGETMIIEIQGSILQPIQKSDVVFKRGHVAVAVNYDVKRIADKYYLYAQLPTGENNYTLFINNIATTVNGIPRNLNFNQSFSTLGELVSYSINPGFLVANQDLRFTLTFNKDQQEAITADFPSETQLTLNPGVNTITLPISTAEPGFRLINIGAYSVPVFILPKEQQQTAFIPNIRFFPPRIDSVALLEENRTYPVKIINDGDSSVSGLYLNYDSELFVIIPQVIPTIEQNQSFDLNLTIKRKSSPISSEIFLFLGDLSKSLAVNITFTQNLSEVTTPYLEENYSASQGYYCQELGGVFCPASEVCSTETVSTLNGQCCTSVCQQPEKKSYSWIGWLFGILALIIIIWVFIKYKKTKSSSKKANPLAEIISKRPTS